VRIQLWSYNYDPEPQGIAPLSAMLARSLRGLGHEVLVVAAHPHYPEPTWGKRIRPYRERREGVSVLRLPLWIGRGSGAERMRQEISFAASQALVAPLLPTCDAIIAVTPCFPALLPAMVHSRIRRTPWVMWLQDIVTDGAVTTGLIDETSPALKLAQRLELASYRSADRVVVISEAFRTNLEAKGVDADKLVRVFNPSSRQVAEPNDVTTLATAPPTILAMGNIGHSQGLDRIVDAFEASPSLEEQGARLSIVGGGVAVEQVRARIQSDRVEMPGVLYGPELEPVLRGASLGLVSQRADVLEFNLPSKLMNYMAYGIPVLASVRVGSETARIVDESGCGWATDASNPDEFAEVAARVLRDPAALAAAGRAGFSFAQQQFDPMSVARRFESILEDVGANGRGVRSAGRGA
jgi:colanic acid biosynthesis glycosyl transferase WcaI